jgi:hypothetical protein
MYAGEFMSTDIYKKSPKKVTTLDSDETNMWLNRINMSLKWRQPYEDVWNRILDYFKGKYFNVLTEDEQICVNMVYPHVKVVIPSIYSRNPDVIVIPRRRELYNDDIARKRAEIMQNLLRYLLKSLDVKSEVKLCILDGILTGHAWVKTGYDTEFEKIDDEKKEKQSVISSLLQKLGVKEKEEEEDTEFQPNEKIVSERPWALRASPYDMIVPALSRRPEELGWIGERIIRPYEEVMENPNYNTEGLKPSANGNELLASLRGGKYNKIPLADDIKYSVLYEIWCGESEQVYTFAEGHKKPLEVKDSEYTFLDSRYHPYVMLRFNETPDEFYPMSDIEPAEPQLLELNETRSQMVNHRKRYNRRYVTKPGALDPQAKADLKAGADGTVVELTPTYSEDPIDGIIYPVQDAALPPEVYAVESRVKDDIYTILGTSDYASRASGGARTATEASIISSQTQNRVQERIDLIESFVNRIVRNIAQISQKYLDAEQLEPVLGEDAIFWVQLNSRKEIQGEYSYNIVYGSSTPINKDVDRSQFMQFYAMAKDDPMYDQEKLRLELVRKFDLENPESWLVKELQAQIEQLRAIALKNTALGAGSSEDASQSLQSLGRVPRPEPVQKLPTGQPQGIGAARAMEPEVPGGTGGTNLA